jgi:Fe-Mn family superoxide dismutase
MQHRVRKPEEFPPRSDAQYQAREFDFSKVKGISREALDDHLQLYRGYVENTNKVLKEALSPKPGQGKQPTPDGWAHRLGFEYNGVVLHELFFDQLRGPGVTLPAEGVIAQAADISFGSVQGWREHVTTVARTRGIGWVMSARDWRSNRLHTFWIAEHHIGIPAGLEPVFVLDLWEHAYLRDFGVKGREQWVEAVLDNTDWQVIEDRCA